MANRHRAFALSVAVVLVSSGLFAQKKDDKKQDDTQKREILSVVKVVDDMATGQAAPNDVALSWVRDDMMKAQGNREYVPFTVSLDPSKISGGSVALYWRVVKSGTAAAPPPPPANEKRKKDDKKDDKNAKRPVYDYEDVTFVPVTAGAGPMRISRSFTVPAGSYDVYVVAKEPSPSSPPKKNAPAPMPKTSVIKQIVTVPDFWNGDLNTSSVIVTERIEPLAAPLTPQQQLERPYALGGMELVPALDLKFSKKDELSTFILIYNSQTDATNKPNVTIEYNFCQAAAGNQPKEGEPCKAGEKLFNKTNPQALNATTLPPEFDLALGHQLQSGQAVPLASFPEGEYRLEIKVTDKVSNKSVIKDVNFIVSAL